MSTEIEVPEEFAKVIKDFVGDLKTTFPEYNSLISKWWKDRSVFAYIENEEERNKAIEASETTSTKLIFSFCQKKLPPRFFDILYKNEDIFKPDYEGDTEFLPHIHFKNLWQFDLSQTTRDTIWKYLQLIMFAIVGSLNNKEAFGDSAKLFEAINQDEFKNKLEETLTQMQGFFDLNGKTKETGETGKTEDKTGMKYGLSYNFGQFSVAASQSKVESTSSIEAKTTSFGAAFAPTKEITIGLIHSKTEADGILTDARATTPDEKIKAVNIGYNLGPVVINAMYAQGENVGGVANVDTDALHLNFTTKF